MLFDVIKICLENISWKFFSAFHRIDEDTLVLALAAENEQIDAVSVQFFPDFLNKRFAKKGVILVDKKAKEIIMCPDTRVKILGVSRRKIKRYFDLYCFYKFSDRLVFTYVSSPKDNKLIKYIEQSDISEEDVVRLALFRLG